jgi:hypothetical protein
MEAVSLMELLAKIPDPRRKRGLRHPLHAVLGLVVVAMLAGMKSLEAISQFGRDHGPKMAGLLGFCRKTPAKSTLSVVLRAVDSVVLEGTLREWVMGRLSLEGKTLPLDGKTLRGSADGDVPGQHLLALYAAEAKSVVAQIRVDGKTNEHKMALKLLGVLPLKGAVVSGDAMFCHRDVCQTIRQQGGDYLLTVKDNQPTLRRDIEAVFAGKPGFSPLGPREVCGSPAVRVGSPQGTWTA